jgi:hypothetical protein
MKSRPFAFALLFTASMLLTGCCWCRPWGHCGRHCCYLECGPETATPSGGAEVRALAAPARPAQDRTTLY